MSCHFREIRLFLWVKHVWSHFLAGFLIVLRLCRPCHICLRLLFSQLDAKLVMLIICIVFVAFDSFAPFDPLNWLPCSLCAEHASAISVCGGWSISLLDGDIWAAVQIVRKRKCRLIRWRLCRAVFWKLIAVVIPLLGSSFRPIGNSSGDFVFWFLPNVITRNWQQWKFVFYWIAFH